LPSTFAGKPSTSQQEYGPRHAAYDLKKFRGKGLVRLIGKSRRYEPTPNGLRMISGLMALRERILEPLIRRTVNHESTAPAANPTSLDQRYRTIGEQLEGIFRDLGLAA
jgi:hypothetical protein